MEREFNNGNVNGILRKCSNVANQSSAPTTPLDLLVFGYGCKLFRDDSKAREIDHGKHLIPWMGDNNLKIDRYDVRGALYDLTPFEPPPGGYGNRLDYLSADEQRAEQLCEEERYLFLYKNETDFLLQQEENAKRFGVNHKDTYKEVQLDYDNLSTNIKQQPPEGCEDSTSCEGNEEAFKLPINFVVPTNILLPTTMKQHAIIEKTARFIASHGVQMEILLKAKQCNNAQFEFLAQNSILNPYYKFITNAIKNGIYPSEETVDVDENEVNSKKLDSGIDSITEDDNIDRPPIAIPTVKYTPSANCTYTQLISKIKGVPLTSVLDEKISKLNAVTSTTTASTNAVQNNAATQQNTNDNVVKSNSETHVELLKNSSTIQALAQNYSSDDDDEDDENDVADADENEHDCAQKSIVTPDPVLEFPVPTENLKNIIDKTATYVIKNGRQFEDTLRTKSAERFAFLLPDSKYYPYYMYKVTGDPDAASKEQKTRKAAAVAAALISKKGLNVEKTASPVSFSIKSKEDNTTAAMTPALPQEASDDDDDESFLPQKKYDSTENPRNMPEHVQKAIKLVERNLMARNVATVFAPKSSQTNANTSTSKSSNDECNNDSSTATKNNRTHLKGSKLESERNAIFELQQQNRHKELKKAEEKVKDKLAQIAREKLGGLLSKEKQLQMERKRKAEAFLNQIKGTSVTKANKSEQSEESKAAADNVVSDDSECSVHSVPITYYGPEEKTDDDDDETQLVTQLVTASVELPVTVAKCTAKNKLIPTVTNSDDDVEVINDITTTMLRMSSRVKNYVKDKYHHTSRSRSPSRSRDGNKYLSKKRHYRDASNGSKSSTNSSGSDASRSYARKRSKSDRKHSSELSARYSHVGNRTKTSERMENSSSYKSKKSRSSRDRNYDSTRNSLTDEHRAARYKESYRKRDNKISERSSRSYRSKEKH